MLSSLSAAPESSGPGPAAVALHATIAIGAGALGPAGGVDGVWKEF